ncbi:MAG: AMP-binding protein [Burkholderiaceae bacterium]
MSQLHALVQRIEAATGRHFPDAAAFHEFSCREPELFWRHALEAFGMPFDGQPHPACAGSGVRETRFFPQLQLNPAQWLLWPASAEIEQASALTVVNELGGQEDCSRAALRDRAMRVAAGLDAAGLRAGERVVAIGHNSIGLIEAFLGTVALGAVWSSVGPDLGPPAVLSRFGQLEPSVIFVDESYRHHGQQHDLHAHLGAVLEALPSVRLIVRLHRSPPQTRRRPRGPRRRG